MVALNTKDATMDIILTLIVLMVSVILHEVAHGYAANALGDPTARLSGRLTMNPLPHLDPVGSVIVPLVLVTSQSGILFGWAKPVPYNPYNLRNARWGEAIVAVAGSATNLLIAAVFIMCVHAASAGIIPASAGAFAGTVAFINLFLGLFNLVPVPPLDGYTVLRGILPYTFSYKLMAFEDHVRNLGMLGIIVVLLAFSFVFAGPFFALVSHLFAFLIGA